ncbi:MAG: hypothetical protein M3O09_08505, partial [Acidobacteriota bacterium]|nr:hypothetical protein [Acidobacteriota bacterium]
MLSPKPELQIKSSPTTGQIFTAGERFNDGVIFDLVQNPKDGQLELLRWSRGKSFVAPQIKFGGRTYSPLLLDPTVLRAIRWPLNVCDYGSSKGLFESLANVISRFTNLPVHDAQLISYFVLSTWLADALTMVPNLAILGTYTADAIQLLRLLSCLCRRPIVLANVSHTSLLSFPVSLNPTLLLDRPRLTPTLQHLLACSNRPAVGLIKSGTVVNGACPKVIFLRTGDMPEIMSGSTVQISLPVPNLATPLLNSVAINEISAEFQPRLLSYRLNNYHKLSPTAILPNGCNFEPNTRELATILAACVIDDPAIAAAVFPLLQQQSDSARGSQDSEFV